MDYEAEDFTGDGYYLVRYGRSEPPTGPYDSIQELATANILVDYPAYGYVVWYDDEGISNVPSLNPDDLVCPRCKVWLPVTPEDIDDVKQDYADALDTPYEELLGLADWQIMELAAARNREYYDQMHAEHMAADQREV